MAKKQKYYVVWNGNTPGIYTDWESCLLQIKGYANAKYKAFEQKSEAEYAYKTGWSNNNKKSNSGSSSISKPVNWRDQVLASSIAVDAACAGNPGDMEYRGVDLDTNTELFHVGPLKEGTNNLGEFLAIVHALALFQKQNKPHAAIYSDSRTAISWIKKKKHNSTITFNAKNKPLHDLIIRAQQWLETNRFSNPIIKWETDIWGEIPADFGRK